MASKPATDPKPKSKRKAPRAQPLAIVAEDDKTYRLGIQRMLENLGFQVALASDGEEALIQMNTLGGADLLVTDLVMPNMDGLTLIMVVTRQNPNVPVLAISGANNSKMRLFSAQSRGAVGILSKPFDWNDFREAVNAVTRS